MEKTVKKEAEKLAVLLRMNGHVMGAAYPESAISPAAAFLERLAAEPEPKPFAWMTKESERNLKRGGNCKGTVPVHGRQSHVATVPIYSSSRIADDLSDKIREKLMRLQLGGCTCGTKTPNIEHHDENCVYRIAAEIGLMLKDGQPN
jgi:hypothetical protein